MYISQQLDLTLSAYARLLAVSLIILRSELFAHPRSWCQDLISHNPFPMLTVILSADLARTGFSEVAHEDFFFWLELFKARPSIRYGCLPEILAFYCIHQKSLSSYKVVMPFWAYRVFRNSGQTRSRSVYLLTMWGIDHFWGRLSALRSSKFLKIPVRNLLAMPPLPL